MKIIITDSGLFWNPWNPVLKKYKDLVTVVWLRGTNTTDEYNNFICPQKCFVLGMSMGVGSIVYKNLESELDRLLQMIGVREDVLFLTDNSIESLYPYLVIKNNSCRVNLHLLASPAWYFEGEKKVQVHNELLSNLSKLKSVCYVDTTKYIYNRSKSMEDTLAQIGAYYDELLPILIEEIPKIEEASYFDLSSKKYIPLNNELDKQDIFQKIKDNNIELKDKYVMEGEAPVRLFFDDKIDRLAARIDGKEICDMLCDYRKQLAAMNNIEFISEECGHVGPCAGTCDKCDEEAEYLRDELSKIPKEKQKIPRFEL
nr:membrane receptor RagA [uncultured Lachnoanaerobaculum sp.]